MLDRADRLGQRGLVLDPGRVDGLDQDVRRVKGVFRIGAGRFGKALAA